MVIGVIRSALSRLLRSPGIESVYRLRRALPDRGSVLRALFSQYPALRSDEIDLLADVGYKAAEAAEIMSALGPSEGFPVDDIPINEYLGIEPGDMNRGRIAIQIEAPNLNFPREGGWQFYVDGEMGETRGEFMNRVRAQAKEMIEAEAAYHEDFTMPDTLDVQIEMKWMMRLY